MAANDDVKQNTSSLMDETRTFPPSQQTTSAANVTQDEYRRAADDRLKFWEDNARELVSWDKPFTEVLDWSNPPFAKWFADGTLNVAYNCLDRHVEAGNGDRVAIHFEGEPGDSRSYTYAQLTEEVCKTANALASLGVKKGDRVAVYLPMIPEAVITMLACARLGAAHSVVFGGFSADALHSRIEDAQAEVVVTADGGFRRGKPSDLKGTVDAALSKSETSVKHVLVVKRTGEDTNMVEGRDQWFHDVVGDQPTTHTPEFFEAENPLFVLYTSGTTGKPKGILHTSGGYLTQAVYTMRAVFDIKPETDVYWCTADIGWITGHTYVTYGPLAAGATQVIYEGTPDTPHQGRWWEIVEKYKATILYAAPTAIRTFMKWGEEIPQKYDLSSLRLLGSVGEPINPEAWMWYRRVIGRDELPIMDTWWQTETGAHMIAPLPGVTALKPGSAQTPLPGITVEVVDDNGHKIGPNQVGLLVIKEPWPSMARTVYGDPERFKETYWSRFEGMYFAGDGARYDDDGDIWFLGRVDDVMNVSGHRLSTTEIESALVSHPSVAEAAVVGATDETTGQAVVAYCVLTDSHKGDDADTDGLVQELRTWVGQQIGPIAKPKHVFIVNELPKTRSGKIMRRLLKDTAEGRQVGDTSTLADATVMQAIADEVKNS